MRIATLWKEIPRWDTLHAAKLLAEKPLLIHKIVLYIG